MGFDPDGIAFHHSATADDNNKEPDTKAIRRYHTEKNGWDGIGYHKLVENVAGDVKVINGRPDNEAAAHVGGKNSYLLGICFIGDYSEKVVPQRYLELGAETVVDWMDQYNIVIDRVRPHREWSGGTKCPGTEFPVNKFKKIIKDTWFERLYNNDFPEGIQVVQRILDTAGYSPGPVDGIMGDKTRQGIKRANSDLLGSKSDEWTHDLFKSIKKEHFKSDNDAPDKKIQIIQQMNDKVTELEQDIDELWEYYNNETEDTE